MVLCLFLITACETDNDSNPTLTDPTEFVLNVPAYASTVYDLKHSETLELTCSQPNYGFPMAVNYSVQVSLTGTFSEDAYKELPSIYSASRMNVDALEIATAIVELSGFEDEASFNEEYGAPVKIFIRLNAALSNGMKPILSNTIELPKVQAYYALAAIELPSNMYVIGSINEWKWENAFSMIPVHSAPGKFWKMVYLGEGAEIKFNNAKDWNGSDFGYDGTTITDAGNAGIENSGGNIKITNAGWYLVVVMVEAQGREFLHTVEFLQPNVYLCGNASGGTWGAGTDNIFTVPETADGEFVSPAFIGNAEGESDGGVRACIKLEGQEWWHTEFMVFGGKIEYRGTGGDQSRIVGSIGDKLYFNFSDNTGRIE